MAPCLLWYFARENAPNMLKSTKITGSAEPVMNYFLTFATEENTKKTGKDTEFWHTTVSGFFLFCIFRKNEIYI